MLYDWLYTTSRTPVWTIFTEHRRHGHLVPSAYSSGDGKGFTCCSIGLNHRLSVLARPRVMRSPQRAGTGTRPLAYTASVRAIMPRQNHSQASPPLAEPLHLRHPPELQFLVPLGVPLYPVDSIRFDRTSSAPTRRFIQFERCDASDASV